MKTGIFIQNNVIYVYYFANLNEKDITDNRKFWDTVKPFFSEKFKSRESIALIEKGKQF